MAPCKGTRLASCVASGTTEIQGHRQVWRTRRGGLRIPSLTAESNLDCAFVENATFLHRSLIVKSQQNKFELVTRPGEGASRGFMASKSLLSLASYLYLNSLHKAALRQPRVLTPVAFPVTLKRP